MTVQTYDWIERECCEYEHGGPHNCPVIVHRSHSAKYGSQNYLMEQRCSDC